MSSISRRFAGLGAAIILGASCNRGPDQKAVATPASASIPRDPSSYANTEAFVTRHLVLDLTADFDAKTLSGTAELQLERRDSNASELVLDTRDLTIRRVESSTDGKGWMQAAHHMPMPWSSMPRPLPMPPQGLGAWWVSTPKAST